MRIKDNHKIMINDIDTYFKYINDIVLLDKLTHKELSNIAYSLEPNKKKIIEYFNGYPSLMSKSRLVYLITKYYHEIIVIGSDKDK